MSFLLTSSPALGSSTAIFGLIVAEAAFLYQNRRILGNRSQAALGNILIVVLLNLGIGATPGSAIDNWGHVGGLLGGLVLSWCGLRRWTLVGLQPAGNLVVQRVAVHTQVAGFVV